MNTACHDFRGLLERRLMGLPDPPRVSQLDWHEHVHACEDCRELLHSEEALEELLASLPELRLPVDLAQRVLARLRASARLDALLDVDSGAGFDGKGDEPLAAPPGLAARVLASLAPERRDLVLERLLDRAGDVVVPPGLGERVLAGLAPHRLRPVGGGVRLRVLRAPALAFAAAALVLSLGFAAFWRLRTERPGDGTGAGAGPNALVSSGDSVPDGELLAALDVLEHWDLLADVGDPDLAAFNRFDAGDEALLEFFGTELLGDESAPEGSEGR